MIVYGSRMYFRTNRVESFGDCQNCGQYTRQRSYQARKFGHLYWIPILPMGAKSQVMNECSACNMGAHIPLADLAPRLEGLKEQFKSWVTKIQDGQTEITVDGDDQPVNAGILIAGIMEDLYCLNEIENADSICQILDACEMPFETNLVKGRWSELTGDLASASQAYQAAHQINSQDSATLYQWAMVAIKQGDSQVAESTLGKYAALNPDDISPWVELASMYEGLKNHAKIVEMYDKIYSMNNDLVAEKAMKKVYKKACKKSGLTGQFLSQM